MSPPKVTVGKIPGNNYETLFWLNFTKYHKYIGGDMSPRKVCIENLVNGQRNGVPAQHGVFRFATFSGDIVSPPKVSSPVLPFVVVFSLNITQY